MASGELTLEFPTSQVILVRVLKQQCLQRTEKFCGHREVMFFPDNVGTSIFVCQSVGVVPISYSMRIAVRDYFWK